MNKVEKIIGYKFKNKGLLVQAYTLRSYTNEPEGKNALFNGPLATIGDAVLKLYILQGLIKHSKVDACGIECPTKEELTVKKSELECRPNFARITEKLGLSDPNFLRLAKGDRANGVYKQVNFMGELLEAIIGAVAVDCDFDNTTLKKVVLPLVCID